MTNYVYFRLGLSYPEEQACAKSLQDRMQHGNGHFCHTVLTNRPDTMMPNMIHPVSPQTQKISNQKLTAGLREDMTRRGVTLMLLKLQFIQLLSLVYYRLPKGRVC